MGLPRELLGQPAIGDFKAMNQSLAEAKDLIDGLGLDQQIIAFLQR